MKITIGEWKTRGGRKAIVAAVSTDPHVYELHRCLGWVDSKIWTWREDGICSLHPMPNNNDLISPWADPVPWDWSTTPPWINWIAMEHSGNFFLYENEPVIGTGVWDVNGGSCHRVPKSHIPKWSGDWKLSKTQRPKEVAK